MTFLATLKVIISILVEPLAELLLFDFQACANKLSTACGSHSPAHAHAHSMPRPLLLLLLLLLLCVILTKQNTCKTTQIDETFVEIKLQHPPSLPGYPGNPLKTFKGIMCQVPSLLGLAPWPNACYIWFVAPLAPYTI